MNYTFTIPGRLPSLNEMIREARGNKYAAARTKREMTELCGWEAKRQHVPPMTGPIILSVLWVEKDMRRDIDNIAFACKYLLDGLQLVNVIANDNWKCVNGITHRFAVDSKKPRVVVELQEA